jgi:hypothetical protein
MPDQCHEGIKRYTGLGSRIPSEWLQSEVSTRKITQIRYYGNLEPAFWLGSGRGVSHGFLGEIALKLNSDWSLAPCYSFPFPVLLWHWFVLWLLFFYLFNFWYFVGIYISLEMCWKPKMKIAWQSCWSSQTDWRHPSSQWYLPVSVYEWWVIGPMNYVIVILFMSLKSFFISINQKIKSILLHLPPPNSF